MNDLQVTRTPLSDEDLTTLIQPLLIEFMAGSRVGTINTRYARDGIGFTAYGVTLVIRDRHPQVEVRVAQVRPIVETLMNTVPDFDFAKETQVDGNDANTWRPITSTITVARVEPKQLGAGVINWNTPADSI